jgi:hypothetical protein
MNGVTPSPTNTISIDFTGGASPSFTANNSNSQSSRPTPSRNSTGSKSGHSTNSRNSNQRLSGYHNKVRFRYASWHHPEKTDSCMDCHNILKFCRPADASRSLMSNQISCALSFMIY